MCLITVYLFMVNVGTHTVSALLLLFIIKLLNYINQSINQSINLYAYMYVYSDLFDIKIRYTVDHKKDTLFTAITLSSANQVS